VLHSSSGGATSTYQRSGSGGTAVVGVVVLGTGSNKGQAGPADKSKPRDGEDRNADLDHTQGLLVGVLIRVLEVGGSGGS
jgi:hypothetical protein